ncbi:MAG TPA: trypsin-like serine protease, partial [Polyangiales bacterium]|nr:trypsin-like serine protease [Polyangiales bacterium]
MSVHSRMAVKLGAVGLLLLAGCLQAHELEPSTGVSLKAAAVIGGFEADSPKLNAVGSISRLKKGVSVPIDDFDAGLPAAEPALTMSCSGALLNDRTVLTAKHCTGEFAAAARSDETLVFALGPDALHPTAYATVIDVEEAPGGTTQGFARNGHDVAVLHLLEPLEGALVV